MRSGQGLNVTPPVLAVELAGLWGEIQRHHPELPHLVSPESLIGEASSACGPGISFERLLHEAAHGLAAARGIRDTSRAGRYHNRRFLQTAQELGLCHPEPPRPGTGFSLVVMRRDTRERYRTVIDRLQRAVAAHTDAAMPGEPSAFRGPQTRNGPSGGGVRAKAVCSCGRNIRIVPSVLVKAPIVCGACEEPFRISKAAATAW